MFVGDINRPQIYVKEVRMLGYGVTDDKELIDNLTEKIYGERFGFVIGYVFYEDDEPIGIANLTVTPTIAEIKSIGILPDKRNKGFGNFFSRCLLLRLSEVSEKIIVYKNDYFYQFGFVLEGEKMSIDSEKIEFPSDCKHNTEKK